MDSIVAGINNSDLFLKMSFLPDTTLSTSYFREDYYVDRYGKIAKVRDFQGGNLAKVTIYYFYQDKLLKVDVSILTADTVLNSKTFYFDNGRPLTVSRKQKNTVSYFVGKANNILKTIYNQ